MRFIAIRPLYLKIEKPYITDQTSYQRQRFYCICLSLSLSVQRSSKFLYATRDKPVADAVSAPAMTNKKVLNLYT